MIAALPPSLKPYFQGRFSPEILRQSFSCRQPNDGAASKEELLIHS
jgi:hypothetical protein